MVRELKKMRAQVSDAASSLCAEKSYQEVAQELGVSESSFFRCVHLHQEGGDKFPSMRTVLPILKAAGKDALTWG